jgi:hypothetical protein
LAASGDDDCFASAILLHVGEVSIAKQHDAPKKRILGQQRKFQLYSSAGEKGIGEIEKIRDCRCRTAARLTPVVASEFLQSLDTP